MKSSRWIPAASAVPFLFLFVCPEAKAQLRILVTGETHRSGEPITVKLINDGSKPIVFCRSFCGSLVVDIAWGVPSFDVRMERSKGSLLWGCDVGALDVPESIEAKQAAEFRIKLVRPGKYRLRLRYVVGDLPDSVFHKKCEESDIWKKARSAKSRYFAVK